MEEKITYREADEIILMDQFVVYDDAGVIRQGLFHECIDSIIDWTKSPEARELYFSEELSRIRNYFKGIDESIVIENEGVEFFGFTVKKLKIKKG